MAFARSAGSVNMIMISERTTTETIAPPKPWTARAVMRNVWEVASPHASEAIVKTEIPMRKRRRCP
jgi:hypothetical protein